MHDWDYYPGDEEARAYIPPQPKPILGNMAPKADAKDVFAERCKTDPQGVIKDLLGQTTRQGKDIHDLNETVKELMKRIEKLEKQ